MSTTLGKEWGVDLLLIIGRFIPELSDEKKNSIAEALIRGF
jgi:hypothetical protein